MAGRPVVLVPGTWSWRGKTTSGEWHCPGSPLVQRLEAQGWAPQTFPWSTRVGGLFWQKQRHLDWEAAGVHLAHWLDPAHPTVGVSEPAPVICHSHALQVVLYACADNRATIPLLISVCSPIRDDMRECAMDARKRIGRWVHLYADWSDRMQWFGTLFDGTVGITRQHDLADVNVNVNGAGHSGALWKEPWLSDWARWLAERPINR